eukprot:12095065-Prorocentrum_lima.AAC.1
MSIYSGGIHADCVTARGEDGEDEDPFGYVTEMVASWNHLMHTYKSGFLTVPPRDFAHSISTDPDGTTTLHVHNVDELHREVLRGLQDYDDQNGAVPRPAKGP